MNTSLFVGLCEDAGLKVGFSGGIAHVHGGPDECLADISEVRTGDYSTNLLGVPKEHAELISEIVPEYALTPIEERE